MKLPPACTGNVAGGAQLARVTAVADRQNDTARQRGERVAVQPRRYGRLGDGTSVPNDRNSRSAPHKGGVLTGDSQRQADAYVRNPVALLFG